MAPQSKHNQMNMSTTYERVLAGRLPERLAPFPKHHFSPPRPTPERPLTDPRPTPDRPQTKNVALKVRDDSGLILEVAQKKNFKKH